MVRLLLVGSLSVVLFVGCGRTVDVERVCDLNDEFAALNERTLPNIEDDPFPAPAMLEENFVEGARLMREMLDVAPEEIRADLAAYVESNEKLLNLYAEFDFDREELWSTMDEETYVSEYSFDEAGRTRVGAWFVEHCGKELQG